MATQRTARTIAGPTSDLDKLADPIDRIAVMFAELGTELGVLGEQLRGPNAERATTNGESTTNTEGETVITGERSIQRGGHAAAPPDRPEPPGPAPGSRRARPAVPDRIPFPEATIRTGSAPVPGEPVDTSFAEPTQTPAAQAAGAAPHSGAVPAQQDRAHQDGGAPQGAHDRPGTAPHPRRAGSERPAANLASEHEFARYAASSPASARGQQPDGFLTWLNRPVGGGEQAPPPGCAMPPAPPLLPPKPPMLDRLANWTSRQGTRVLAWSGAAITLLGVVLLMVMAVQNGWIGPLGRVAGGAALGAVLLGSAFWVRHRSAVAGAFALAATGIAVLYLDVLAATALYDFLPAPAGLATALVLGVLGLWLADRWRSQALAVGVVLGCALCAPLLFGPVLREPPATALLTAFLVVLKIAATPVQVRRAWRGLTAASAVPAILAALVGDGHALVAGTPWPAACAALAVTAAGLALAVLTARRRPRDPLAIALLITAATPTLLAAPMLGRLPALGVLAFVAALHFAVWCAGRAGRLPGPLGIIAGGVGAATAFQATLLVAGGSGRSLSLLAEALLLALLAHRLRGKGLLLGSALFGAAGVLIALVSEVPPTLFLAFAAEPYLSGGTAAMISGLAAFLLIGASTTATTWSAIRLGVLARTPRAVLPAAVGLLYGGGGAVLTLSLLVAPGDTGFLAGHALITVSWMVLAFLSLLRGIHSVPARVAGFVLVGVALAKLLVFDLGALSGLVRVLVFLAAGLILLAGGTRYARLIAERDAREA
ncbi:DUF2339 domain-containing protein [Saccharopolyspora sp. NFXS83]|uniref:DUF2339 domain-containing protein n=1 Tax=Saccharopolyspora sp. NFXS83 TaxID=2993560 RepID=UPI00224A7D11|nr:DUF2339 domain-containing protein [Saccharopolyspora sp. NFXS83]MCX2731313.1 DUF2339 domain-containing protein [Saccharopolyspora sp. NFXS83]